MVQVGDQFKIEIEDVFENEAGEFLYKIKGFRSLVFDEEGILKLTPLSSAIEVTVDCAGNLIRKGDEVIVLGDLGDAYDPHYCFMDEMKRFVGKQFAVSEVYVTPCGEKQVKLYNIRNYKSDIVNGLSDYIWVGKWLMKVEQP